MPGTNGGTGQPFWFCCSKCRARRPSGIDDRTTEIMSRGNAYRVELTGRTRQHKRGNGSRLCKVAFEYRCLDCKHVGWSRHTDLMRKAGYTKDTLPKRTS